VLRLQQGGGGAPPPPRRWHRVLHDDGDEFYFHAGSGESVWELPPGEEEEPAGVWRSEQGPPPLWRCAATGATAGADEDLPLGALTEDCAWQWQGARWRAVALTREPWLQRPCGPWHRVRDGGAFAWRCSATGALRARDGDLPADAATADGWTLRRDEEGDAWWWHGERDEAVWEGPWVAAEAALAAEEAALAPRGGAPEPGVERPPPHGWARFKARYAVALGRSSAPPLSAQLGPVGLPAVPMEGPPSAKGGARNKRLDGWGASAQPPRLH
jgi:hypothetical protein